MKDQALPMVETPRLLTRSIIPTLTEGLDASDVLECYELVRSAPLHGIANSTITIQKLTLGIRFRPKGSDLINPYNMKTPMELTLEYGPQRVGPSLNYETMPIVNEEESSSFLAWDNSGKIYYTQKIVTENFLSSHFMASMTGAVLQKLLDESLGYAEKRKVYQPFAVFSDNGKQLLRSSSSSDFTWFAWSHLARLGVEIEPILPPPVYEARLYAKSVTRIVPDQSITHRAATFYQRLYNCLESIAANNYGSLLPSSSSLLEHPNDDDPSSYIEDEDQNNEMKDTNDNDEHRLVEDINKDPDFAVERDEHKDINKSIENSSNDIGNSIDEESESASELFSDQIVQKSENSTSPEILSLSSQSSAESSNETSLSTLASVPSTAPSITPSSISNETIIPTESVDKNPIQDVDKAQNAANEAQKAADEAKNAAHSEGETKAANAAQAAADAAFAAADATSNAVSQAAMVNLLSGDGALMSSVVSKCFSDPKYKISSIDSNGTLASEFYLFRDSSSYYKLELTIPYIEVAKLNRALPKTADMRPDYGPGGDAIDWMLALSIVVLVPLMVLLVCQQMGNRYVDAIFKCQRWFFNPRKHEFESDEPIGVQSGSHFFFGNTGIPISMGGRRFIPRKGENFQEVVDESIFQNDHDDGNSELQALAKKSHRQLRHTSSSLEVEMTHFPSTDHKEKGRRDHNLWRKNSDPSISSEEDEVIPERLLRNPDLVELPYLKSVSKVAIPVGGSNRSSCSVSVDGESDNNSLSLDHNISDQHE